MAARIRVYRAALRAAVSQDGHAARRSTRPSPHESVREHAVRKPRTALNPTQALGREALQSGAPHQLHVDAARQRLPEAQGTPQRAAERLIARRRAHRRLPRVPFSTEAQRASRAPHGGPPGSSPTSTSTGTKGEESPRAPLQPGLIRPGASGPDFWTARRDAVQGDG